MRSESIRKQAREAATMEPMEDRRLLSTSWSMTQQLPRPASQQANLSVQNIGRSQVVTTAAVTSLVGRSFEGTLLVTKSIVTRVVGGLGAGAAPAGSELPVRLHFSGVNLEGQLVGKLAVRGLGLVGPLGAFDVVGTIRGRKITLVLNDNGTGVARVEGKVSKNGQLIGAKFTSNVYGDITRGDLQLLRARPTDAELFLGFVDLGGGFVSIDNGFIFSSGQNGLFISFSTNRIF